MKTFLTSFDNIVVNESAAVPEPLTILGTTIALGFRALFKKKRAKKNKSHIPQVLVRVYSIFKSM